MKDRSSKKDGRIYDWWSLVKRHKEYYIFKIKKGLSYDFKQQALKEFVKCQKWRKYVSRSELKKFSMELDGNDVCILSNVAVSVTNQCSLRCKDCNNLMPYCKEFVSISAEDLINDIKNLLKYVDQIVSIEIIGGEPFIYAQIPKLLEYVCREKRIRFVRVTTNGIVLPSKEVVELLSDPKVCVSISDYGEVNAKKAKEVYKYLTQNHICVKYLKNMRWIASGGINKRNKRKRKMKYEYFHCDARKNCRTLYKGKLYVCGRAPVLDELGLLTGQSSYLDIRGMKVDKTAGKKQIQKFYMNYYAECCDYCDYSSDKVCWVQAGIQASVQRRENNAIYTSK